MKKVIVTGCSCGIGKVIAQQLSTHYSVIGIDKISPKHLFCHSFYCCDLANNPFLMQTVATIQQDYSSIYALINNAGIFAHSPLESQSFELWQNVIALNLTAPYLLSQAFAPLLGDSRGHIINIASTRALMSESGTEPYSASKGGIVALTHALSISLAGKVSVNSISPGWINTDESYKPTKAEHAWHPSGRVGKPSDIAELVVFLLEREEGFITGSDFVVDGGVSKKMLYP